MATDWDWLLQFIDPLDRVGIPYALVGSVASSIYGEPRATNDVDLVIEIDATHAAALVQAFPEDHFYVPPAEVILAELGRRQGAHLNVIALESMIKADLYPLAEDQRHWFGRRRSLAVGNRQVWVAAPEVIILNKLLFYREGGGEKHLRDIQAMLSVKAAGFDAAWLESEAVRIGVAQLWQKAQTGSPGPALG